MRGGKFGDDLELYKTDFWKVFVKSLFVWVRVTLHVKLLACMDASVMTKCASALVFVWFMDVSTTTWLVFTDKHGFDLLRADGRMHGCA